MSTAAATAEPRHHRGGAGGAVLARRPARRATQMVDIPERVYRGSHYSDVFVKVWAKIAALDVDGNPEHCNAHVTELARFAGVSVRDVERALAEGRTPGPDGMPEFTTRRMTRSGGTGRTAIRQVRPVTTAERSLRVPVTMCEALTPRQLRAALLAAHAEADGHIFTAAELAGELFHHHGKNKGRPLADRTARRVLQDLEELGWIGVGHRSGRQGRNTVTVHRHPLRHTPVVDALSPATEHSTPQKPTDRAGQPSADIHGGSGADDHGGSLASKEDRVLTDEFVQAGGPIRRRRDTGSTPGDTPGTPVPDSFGGPGRTLRADTAAAPRPPYTGPALTLAPRIWDVLEPVRPLLPGIRTYLMRQIAREIGRQLNTGTEPARLRARLQHRYACTDPIRDPGRWLLGAGLPRRGCGLDDCESGVIWRTGMRCEVCADIAAARHRQPTAAPSDAPPGAPPDAPAPRPRPVWHECATCRAPSRAPLTGGLCAACRTAA